MNKAIKKFFDICAYINMCIGMCIICGLIMFVILYPIIDILVYKGIL